MELDRSGREFEEIAFSVLKGVSGIIKITSIIKICDPIAVQQFVSERERISGAEKTLFTIDNDELSFKDSVEPWIDL